MKPLALVVTLTLGVSLAAGCQLVFHSAGDIDAAKSDAAGGDAVLVDAASCTGSVKISTTLHQDTYIAKAQDVNFDTADAMQVNGPSTVGLLEFRATIDSATVIRKPRFQVFELTVPVAPIAACASIGCTADCLQTEGVVQLELLADSDWDEMKATWTKRAGGILWTSAGALGPNENLGTIAVAPSSLSATTITFSVNPTNSLLLWSALSAGNEWSFRISASGTARFAYADQNKTICSFNVQPPTLNITYCE